MNKQPNATVISDHLNTICADRIFEKSPRNVRLLHFLVEKAMKQEDVNEYIIGIELFEAHYDPEKNDSKVRVYMYNLRKKLEEYYASTKATDQGIYFRLTKGQYNIEFVETSQTINRKTFLIKSKTWLFGLLSILLVIGILQYLSYKEETCWTPFFETSTPSIAIIADQPMCFLQTDTARIPTIMQNINNKGQYIHYKEHGGDKHVSFSNYSLFSKMAPYSIKDLNTWFIKNDNDFSVRMESQVNLDEVQNSNIIYVGQFKTMTTSKTLYLKNSKRFSIQQKMGHYGFIHHTEDGRSTLYKTNYTNEEATEYALVSFWRMKNGKHALYFVSNNDIGVMATVKNFTNPKWLKEFQNNLPEDRSYFHALFRVDGLNRTDTHNELIALELL